MAIYSSKCSTNIYSQVQTWEALWRKIGGFNLRDLSVRGCFRRLCCSGLLYTGTIRWEGASYGDDDKKGIGERGDKMETSAGQEGAPRGSSKMAHGWGRHVAFWRKNKWNIHILGTDTQYRRTHTKPWILKWGNGEEKQQGRGKAETKPHTISDSSCKKQTPERQFLNCVLQVISFIFPTSV